MPVSVIRAKAVAAALQRGALLVLFAIYGCGGGSAPPHPTMWSLPSCTSVTGITSIAITPDSGATLRMPSTLPAGTYSEGVFSIVPLSDVPDRIVASYFAMNNAGTSAPPALYRSADSGCTWTRTEVLAGSPFLVPGDGTFAAGWVDGNGQYTSTVFVTDESGQIIRSAQLNAFTMGLAVSRNNPSLMLRVDSDGDIWQSSQAGNNWSVVRSLPPGIVPNDVAFDSNDIQRFAVTESGGPGVVFTTNGGLTWTSSTFDFVPTTGSIVMFNIAYSADGSVIWVQGRNVDENCCGNVSQGRHIWRSTDGGLTFTSVVIQDALIQVGTRLYPHPSDPNVVYWANGGAADPYDFLFRYSQATAISTRVELTGAIKAPSLAFNPLDPQYMYIGLLWP